MVAITYVTTTILPLKEKKLIKIWHCVIISDYNVSQEVMAMAQANQETLSVRLDNEDKKMFEEFCSQTGMNVSVCVNMFVKVVLRERKLPFEIKQIKADEK